MEARLLSPKQVAQAIGVSEASLKRWCDSGTLQFRRTAGGHRRLEVSEVVRFLRQSGHGLVRPEVLGLPSNTGKGEANIERARSQVRVSLEQGQEAESRRLILNLYLSGHSVQEICDRVIAEAFHEIGTRWEHHDIDVYQERRAGEICLHALHDLRGVLPTLPESASRAFGGTLEGDPYFIPTTMVELVLREAGWEATSYGIGHPVQTLCAALQKERPCLFWLSVSAVASPEVFIEQYAKLYEAAGAVGAAVVVGGRALTAEVRRAMHYAAYCDTLGHLASLVKSLSVAKAGESR